MLLAQPGHTAPVRDHSWSVLTGRLFPALVAMEGVQARSPVASPVLAERRRRMDACTHAPNCLLHAALWTDAEMNDAATLAERRLTAGQRRDVAPGIDLHAQVLRELKGLNGILQVYGLGAVPRYPQIDGPIDPAGSAQFTANVADAVMLAEGSLSDPITSLDPSIALAVSLLDANNRDEAASFEPLDQKYNEAALAFAKTVDWNSYKYSAIIVLGVGPEDAATPISPRSKLNVRLAAERFMDGGAAFLIVTGGNVHPRGTRSVEAVALRKALIERYGIPAERIVLEPYARHTTTNLRNATRRLMALGAPLDRDTLVVTNMEHSQSIENPDFMTRNKAELGYEPGKVGARISPFEIIFRPDAASARIDPADPLDP